MDFTTQESPQNPEAQNPKRVLEVSLLKVYWQGSLIHLFIHIFILQIY